MSSLTVIVFATVLVIIVAVLVAMGAGKLARLDGATYPAALLRASTAFAAVVTLAAAVTGALAAIVN
ncbi:hypothetical protein [Streptomyces mirabilis]|uniref:hypothetical protein n=1 Tax=Streptomyces mirabilis TaxID=68239 RepID=UPI0036AAE109